MIVDLHRRLCGELTPQFVGWRRKAVTVGTHTPPDAHLVALQMREYGRDLQARLQASGDDERLLEALAFAEGRLLSIHPFEDFNGRTTRLLLRLLLRRLDLPAGDLLPEAHETQVYLAALHAGDRRDWQPLCAIWRQRLVRGVPR